MVRIGGFRDFIRITLIIETNPPAAIKPTKVGFIFIGPNCVSRAAVNPMTQAVVCRVGSKIEP